MLFDITTKTITDKIITNDRKMFRIISGISP